MHLGLLTSLTEWSSVTKHDFLRRVKKDWFCVFDWHVKCARDEQFFFNIWCMMTHLFTYHYHFNYLFQLVIYRFKQKYEKQIISSTLPPHMQYRQLYILILRQNLKAWGEIKYLCVGTFVCAWHPDLTALVECINKYQHSALRSLYLHVIDEKFYKSPLLQLNSRLAREPEQIYRDLKRL